jgi:hypothetical protein
MPWLSREAGMTTVAPCAVVVCVAPGCEGSCAKSSEAAPAQTKTKSMSEILAFIG